MSDGEGDEEDDPAEQSKAEQKTQVEQALTYDPHVVLDQFAKIDYIERYINANFEYGKCYVDEVKKRYEEPGNSIERHARETPNRHLFESLSDHLGKTNMTVRLKLYVDLVSDLMFNFHMVHCLNLRARVANRNSSDYVYIYAHRPTFKARSLFRDHLKTLPNVIGHFAELGEWLSCARLRERRLSLFARLCFWRSVGARLSSNTHQCKYVVLQLFPWWRRVQSRDHALLVELCQNRVCSSLLCVFILIVICSCARRNPNRGSESNRTSDIRWKAYTSTEHNYMFFQLNNIRNEVDYFDSMYQFWSECFQTERNGGCQQTWMKMKKHLLPFFLLVLALVLLLITCLICTQVRKKKRCLSSQARLPIDQLQYPHLIST